MRHRIFILLLAGALILALTLLQNAAQATPYAGGALFGGRLPLWELRAAIPFGIFTAGLYVAAVGMGAMILRSALLLAGKGNSGMARRASFLEVCALWCGWPFMLCCTHALLYIVPRYFLPQTTAHPNHLAILLAQIPYQLYGSLALLVLCRLLGVLLPGRRWVGWVQLVLLWLPAITADIVWAGGHGTVLLTIGAAIIAASLLGGNTRARLLGGALLLMTAVCFVGAMQPRDSAGIFPVGAADFVFYAASLTVIALLSALKISDIRHRNLR